MPVQCHGVTQSCKCTCNAMRSVTHYHFQLMKTMTPLQIFNNWNFAVHFIVLSVSGLMRARHFASKCTCKHTLYNFQLMKHAPLIFLIILKHQYAYRS